MSSEKPEVEDVRERLREASHWVIKLGSNVLLQRPGLLDRPTFTQLVRGVDHLLAAGRDVTLVSSGAVALGRQLLESSGRAAPARDRDIPTLQALAALGQPRLLNLYESEFGHYHRAVAQLLFTRGDLGDRQRYLNARRAIERVRGLGAIPIINENDTVATEELRFGDNDTLAAMTCGLVGAQALVILSDVDGIFDVVTEEDGTRRFTERIRVMDADASKLDEIAGPSSSSVGTGGMISKVSAARTAARVGVPTVIAPGKGGQVLERLLAGEDVGTMLIPDPEGVAGRKVWLTAGAHPVGVLRCDAGARRAVLEDGASLLPAGIVGVEGAFEEGDVVELVDARTGERFGLGISVYDASDTRALMGAHTDEIEDVLGYRLLDCAVHRDNLVVV